MYFAQTLVNKTHALNDYFNRYRGVPMDPALQGVIAAIERGTFGDAKIFQPLISTLTVGKDFYLISADFASYIEANKLVDAAYKNQEEWIKKSIRCTANMGKFSSYVFNPLFFAVLYRCYDGFEVLLALGFVLTEMVQLVTTGIAQSRSTLMRSGTSSLTLWTMRDTCNG
jgi:hypothetical protein